MMRYSLSIMNSPYVRIYKDFESLMSGKLNQEMDKLLDQTLLKASSGRRASKSPKKIASDPLAT